MAGCHSCKVYPHRAWCREDHALSRQRRYQLRNKRKHKCRICPLLNIDGSECQVHIDTRRKREGNVGTVRCLRCSQLGHNSRTCLRRQAAARRLKLKGEER